MDNLKDNIISVFIICIFIISCTNNGLNDASDLCNFKIKDKLKFEFKKELFNDFNGNGYKINVYSIQENLDYFKVNAELKNFKKFNFNDPQNPFKNSEITPFIVNGYGYYLQVPKGNETRIVVIDINNKKLIYYYNIN